VTVSVGMEVQTFTIRNRLGLHARAAALLVKTANRFTSEITLEKEWAGGQREIDHGYFDVSRFKGLEDHPEGRRERLGPSDQGPR